VTPEHFWTVAAYIARNPVEAGLCHEPEGWPWSSHAALLSGERPAWLDIDRLLWHLSSRTDRPLESFVTFVKGQTLNNWPG
jgi:hypothetical protein